MDDEALLHAYVDGQLDSVMRSQVEQRLQGDAAARLRVEQWLLQRQHLRQLRREVLDEPPPQRLLQAAGVATKRRRWRPWRSQPVVAAPVGPVDAGAGRGARWLGRSLLAMALLLTGAAAGWYGHLTLAARGVVPVRMPPALLAGGLAREAIAAHAVYTPDARRPVEIGADQQELLVRWLSKRLGRPLKVPVLDELGWRLVGGRLLSGDTAGAEAARAQFMYENRDGQRLTLYLSVLAAAGSPGAGSTPPVAAAFSDRSQGAVQSFFWIEDRFGYALVAELPREVLHRLVNEVHAQTAQVASASAVTPAP